MFEIFDAKDFRGFLSHFGITAERRAQLGDITLYDVYRVKNKEPHRVDDSEHRIIWYICDYDLSEFELSNLTAQYKSGLHERAYKV